MGEVSGFFSSSSPRRSAAQRQASRRNLVKARQALARKRNGSDIASAGILAAILIALVLLIVTQGLILLPVMGIAGTVVYVRRQRAAQDLTIAARRAEEARWAAYQQQQRELAFAADLGRLLTHDSIAFEHATGTILAAHGYGNVEHMGASGDRGADLRCVDQQGRHLIVQCKRYSPGHKVGSADMQKFIGAVKIHKVSYGLFVTTSEYTKEAVALATQNNIVILDGEYLVAMARSAIVSTNPTSAPYRP